MVQCQQITLHTLIALKPAHGLMYNKPISLISAVS